MRKKEGKTISRELYHERGLTQSSERKLSPKNLKTGQSGEVETCYSVSISTQFQIAAQIIFLKKYVYKDGNATSLNRNHFSLLPPRNLL